MRAKREWGFTLSEVLTALVVLAVLIAVAIPMWRTHELQTRRDDAIGALLAVQKAQDRYFGQHARYATEAQVAGSPPAGLGVPLQSRLGSYRITIHTSADGLGFQASARALPTQASQADTRCAELRIDQNGRRFAADADGVDRSADCWR
jgi:type IV pilus assembly protein PilE